MERFKEALREARKVQAKHLGNGPEAKGLHYATRETYLCQADGKTLLSLGAGKSIFKLS